MNVVSPRKKASNLSIAYCTCSFGCISFTDGLVISSAETILAAAGRQPGARHLGTKITFLCPGCAAEGHDLTHRDHAVVFSDGKWTCVVDPDHRAAIAEALGEGPLTYAALERAHLRGALR